MATPQWVEDLPASQRALVETEVQNTEGDYETAAKNALGEHSTDY